LASSKEFCPHLAPFYRFLKKETVVMKCKTCAHKLNAKTALHGVVYHSYLRLNSHKNVEGRQEVVDQKDLGPLIDRACAKCLHDGLHCHTRQTRSADEGQTV
ncbi:DNA-directed RNA polymerase I subunit RPA12-like, partial [Asterias rubens]|uniref:DNA-directed RNA polymerase I subunit RPA12-like n=1 Tax=Asterias rubens TaxID=7604 RepID=UPI001455C16E